MNINELIHLIHQSEHQEYTPDVFYLSPHASVYIYDHKKRCIVIVCCLTIHKPQQVVSIDDSIMVVKEVYDTAKLIKRDLQKYLYLHPCPNIIFTGFRDGGALAAIVSTLFEYPKFSKQSVICFGYGNVGNEYFFNNLRMKVTIYYRFILDCDEKTRRCLWNIVDNDTSNTIFIGKRYVSTICQKKPFTWRCVERECTLDDYVTYVSRHEFFEIMYI